MQVWTGHFTKTGAQFRSKMLLFLLVAKGHPRFVILTRVNCCIFVLLFFV